ncbi:hypothetical protein CFP56_027682 [Quercus suber]|uniref:Uncharacterized protein n=1 Tax=Quercus suber TaxID=58331 RepID=A0AAW0JW21_QUESU
MRVNQKKANNTRKACTKSSRANDRDEPMTNVDPSPMKFQRHINQSFHRNAHAHTLANAHMFSNQNQAMSSNYGTLHPAHMAASRFPFDQSRAMAGNYGTPPAHMDSMLPNQSQAMTKRFSNQSQVMAIDHGTAPHSPMANMFPNQSRVMTGNHGTPPPAHMANRLPNHPRAMAFNHGASNFHNQPIAGNHETPQAFEPFYSRINPSMHSSESSAIVGNSETSVPICIDIQTFLQLNQQLEASMDFRAMIPKKLA